MSPRLTGADANIQYRLARFCRCQRRPRINEKRPPHPKPNDIFHPPRPIAPPCHKSRQADAALPTPLARLLVRHIANMIVRLLIVLNFARNSPAGLLLRFFLPAIYPSAVFWLKFPRRFFQPLIPLLLVPALISPPLFSNFQFYFPASRYFVCRLWNIRSAVFPAISRAPVPIDFFAVINLDTHFAEQQIVPDASLLWLKPLIHFAMFANDYALRYILAQF